jgi:hypothetical protein
LNREYLNFFFFHQKGMKENGREIEVLDLSRKHEAKGPKSFKVAVKTTPLIISLISSSENDDVSGIPKRIETETEDEDCIDLSDENRISRILSTSSTVLLPERGDSYFSKMGENEFSKESPSLQGKSTFVCDLEFDNIATRRHISEPNAMISSAQNNLTQLTFMPITSSLTSPIITKPIKRIRKYGSSSSTMVFFFSGDLFILKI